MYVLLPYWAKQSNGYFALLKKSFYIWLKIIISLFLFLEVKEETWDWSQGTFARISALNNFPTWRHSWRGRTRGGRWRRRRRRPRTRRRWPSCTPPVAESSGYLPEGGSRWRQVQRNLKTYFIIRKNSVNMILGEGTCVVDIARRVVTPRATLAGTWGTRAKV